MQVAEEHYSSDYRCTISIDSLQEGQQEKEGMSGIFVNFNLMSSYSFFDETAFSHIAIFKQSFVYPSYQVYTL